MPTNAEFIAAANATTKSINTLIRLRYACTAKNPAKAKLELDAAVANFKVMSTAVAALTSTPAPVPVPPPPGPVPLPGSGVEFFGTVQIGGGGFVTGGARSLDWEMCGTDTATSFIRRPREDWRVTMLEHSIPDMPTGPSAEYTDGAGSYAQAVGPGGVAYTTLRGYLIRSDDAFQSRARIVFGPKRMFENRGAQRLWNTKMCLDPNNPDVLLIGCSGGGDLGGAYYSKDGGRTPLVRIAGIPDPIDHDGNPAPILTATNGKTFALAILGSGIWLSNRAEGPYALSAGSSAKCQDMHFDAFDRLVVVDLPGLFGAGSRTPIHFYAGGAWTSPDIGAALDIKSVAVDPRNRDHIVAVNPNGGIIRTIQDSTGAWKWAEAESNIWPSKQPYHCPRRPWQDSTGGAHQGIYPSRIMFDPIIPNRVNMYHGTGTLYFEPPATWGGVELFDTTPGIEQVVCNGGLSVPGGDFFLCGWDKGFFKINDFLKPADQHYPEGIGFTHCWDINRSPSGRTVVALCDSAQAAGYQTSFSIDRGRFQQCKFQHPDEYKLGGSIAAFGERSFLWVPGNNGRAVYTNDAGETPWKYLDLGVPMPTSGESGWSFAMYFNRAGCLASNETPGRGWVVNYGPPGFEHLAGIWQTDNGPAGPWRKVCGEMPLQHWMYYHHMQFEEVPGHADFLLMSGGGAPDHNEPLMASRDGGKTWASLVDGVIGVVDFDFGYSGAAYPITRFLSLFNGKQGLYEIADLSKPVVKLIAEHPAGQVTDAFRTVVGDINLRRWAYGTGGSGWRFSETR